MIKILVNIFYQGIFVISLKSLEILELTPYSNFNDFLVDKTRRLVNVRLHMMLLPELIFDLLVNQMER